MGVFKNRKQYIIEGKCTSSKANVSSVISSRGTASLTYK